MTLTAHRPSGPRWGAAPVIRGGDSLSGIVARAAGLHETTPQQLLATTIREPGVRPDELPAGLDMGLLPRPAVQALSAALDADPLLLAAGTLANQLPLIDPGGCSVGGRTRQSIIWAHLSSSPGCVPCLRERPAHRLLWRLALLPICTRHQLVLADLCPACGQQPFGRPSVAVRPGTDPRCQHCGAPPDVLQARQRQATGGEAAAVRAVESLIGSADPEQLARAGLLRALARILRGIPALLDRIAIDLPAAVAEERACVQAWLRLGCRRALVPPTSSLLAAMLPIAQALAEDPDTLEAETLAAVRSGPSTLGWGCQGKGDPQLGEAEALMALLRATGPTPTRTAPPKTARQVRPVVGGLRTESGASRADLSLLPLLCPAGPYNDLFADLLGEGAAAAGHDGLTAGQGRRAVPVAAAVLLTGWSAHGAAQAIGASGSAGQMVRLLLGGLCSVGRTADLESALRTYLSWLESPGAPDYPRRSWALRTNCQALVAALTGRGVGDAEAVRWLVEEWACDLTSRYGLANFKPRVEAGDLPDGIEAVLDGLIAGEPVA